MPDVLPAPLTELLRPSAALIKQVAAALKASDVKAMRLFGFEDPAAALRLAYERGEVLFVGAVYGEPACVVSVIPKPGPSMSEGSLWMVTTACFARAPVAVLRRSKKIIDGLFEKYALLDTVIDRANPTALGYARFLGFEDGGPQYDIRLRHAAPGQAGEVVLGYFRKSFII